MAGKRYADALKRYDRERLHAPDEAIELVKSLSSAKFDESVELVMREDGIFQNASNTFTFLPGTLAWAS